MADSERGSTASRTTPTADVPSRQSTPEWVVIVSPVVLLALGGLAARLSAGFLGDWAWLGAVPVYWLAMAAVILRVTGLHRAREWYRPSAGSRLWVLLAAVVGLSAFPLLLVPNAGLLLRLPLLAILWVGFALVNGTIEEAYWRGFLLTEIRFWPRWIVATYAGALFVAIHFVMLGAFAPALFNVPFLVILVAITGILTLLFVKTRSLRLPTATHVLSDLGNLNIFVFMGLASAL